MTPFAKTKKLGQTMQGSKTTDQAEQAAEHKCPATTWVFYLVATASRTSRRVGRKQKGEKEELEVRRIKLSKMNGKERRQTKRRADEGKTGNKKEKAHREIGRGQGGRRKK